MLFNEPKLLKSKRSTPRRRCLSGFSALQRAEIAEMHSGDKTIILQSRFSALQRAEIAEMLPSQHPLFFSFSSFSALQRAEIAEIQVRVLNDLLPTRFSALQRAEIAEMERAAADCRNDFRFQCSSTSRNC